MRSYRWLNGLDRSALCVLVGGIRSASVAPVSCASEKASSAIRRANLVGIAVGQGRGHVLTVSWLFASVRGCGPYPILALTGEQGIGKSLTGQMLRSLIDPHIAPLRSSTLQS